MLVAEGVFYGEDNVFAPLPPSEDKEVERLLRRVARRVWKLARVRLSGAYPTDFRLDDSTASRRTRFSSHGERLEPARTRALKLKLQGLPTPDG